MPCFFHLKFFQIYLELGEKNKLPVFVPQILAPHFDSRFLKPNNLVVVNKMYMAEKNISFDDLVKIFI